MVNYDVFKNAFRKIFIIYLRKSRKDGDESVEEVLARHKKMLQDWAIRILGYAISEENIYMEVVSGETIAERPEVQKVLERCEKEDICGVIVVEPQRLTRGDYGEIDRIVKTLQYSNTLVCTPTYTFDLTDKRDKKSFEMDLLRGADYLDYIKDILLRGRKQSACEGKFAGSFAPFGYDKVKLPKGWTLKPNSDAPAVQEVFRAYLSGDGLWTIANRLNALGYTPVRAERWKAHHVKQMLPMEVYIGKICFDKHVTITQMHNGEVIKKSVKNPSPTFYEGLHPAIVDEETFYAVQEKRKRNTAACVPHGKELRNPLSGLVRCEYHHNEILRRKGGAPGYLTGDCKLQGCSNVFASVERIERELLQQISVDLQGYNYILDNYAAEQIKAQRDYHNMIAKIEAQIERYKKGLRIAQRRYNDEEYTQEEYYALKNEYLADISHSEAERDKLTAEAQNVKIERVLRLVPNLQKVLEKYWTLDNAGRNRLLKTMIDRVYYGKDARGADKPIRLEIVYKI